MTLSKNPRPNRSQNQFRRWARWLLPFLTFIVIEAPQAISGWIDIYDQFQPTVEEVQIAPGPEDDAPGFRSMD